MMSSRLLGSTQRAVGSWVPVAKSATSQLRCFSETSSRQAHVITFSRSSSPELDELLSTIRSKFILPSYLRAEQRKNLYRTRNIQKLRHDPATLEIDGEVYKFHYTDPRKDLPPTRKTVVDAIRLLRTQEDWRNFVRLLEGLQLSGRKTWAKPWDLPRVARRAGFQDCILTIIECARQVSKTGFKLDSEELVAEILYWIQFRAFSVPGGWTPARTRTSLTWADMVVEMLQMERHWPAADAKSAAAAAGPAAPKLRHNPQWAAAQLHLAAALYAKFPKRPKIQAQEDWDRERAELLARVTRLAEDLVLRWPDAGKGLRAMRPPPAPDAKKYVYFLDCDNGLLRQGALVVSALRLAGGVVESPELKAELKAREDVAHAELEEVLKGDGHKQWSGRRTYDLLFRTSYAKKFVDKTEAESPKASAPEAVSA